MSTEAIPYRERLEELRHILVRQGSLGLLLIDLSPLSRVEHDYGSRAFQRVLRTATELILELKGSEVRASDVLATSDRGEDAFLIFLSPKRGGGAVRISDLQATASRIENYLKGRLARLGSPYLRGRLEVTVGFAMVLFNPLVMPERLVARLVEEAWECVRLQRMQREFQNRSRLQEILLNGQVTTVFQPIVDLRDLSVLGYEALSRGPDGTAYQSPLTLFEMAEESDLVFELDRLCRRRALLSAKKLPPSAKLFVNVLPSSVYDPDFEGARLIRLLGGLGLGPDRIVFEITEKYAIENYALFGEAIQNFTQMGFSIAVDDMGVGHSGLEKITNVNPGYLKFDIHLVRDIDSSYVRREMVKALKAFADNMDSTIIAEGIEREEELRSLVDLGIRYGQGFLLARPAPGFRRPEPRAGATATGPDEPSNDDPDIEGLRPGGGEPVRQAD